MNTAKEQRLEEKTASILKNREEHRVFTETLEQCLENIKENVLGESEKKVENSIDPKDMLYYVKTACPLCGKKFESPKVRSKYLHIKQVDKDYCKYYESINPLYYEVMVCPQCSFAYNEEIQKSIHMSDKQRQEIKSRLQTVLQDRSLKDYSGVRNLDQAIETFLLALFALEGRHAQSSKKGMLYLKIAWLYRYKNDETKELKYIEKALSSLTSAYEKEIFTDPQTEINTTYLIGALYFKTGNYQEAARWLDRVLRRQGKPALPAVVKQARELWVELRQELRKK